MNDLIPQDLCDTDLYKFSMGQVVFNQFPLAYAKYRYTNRAANKSYRPGFADEVKEQLVGMSDLALTKAMYAFFKEKTPWLKETYLQWLKSFRFKPEQVNAWQDSDGLLNIEIEGPWFETIYWEVPILYIVTYLSHCTKGGASYPMSSFWEQTIIEKSQRLSRAGLNWMDFGTRRRATFEVQDAVCRIMKEHAPLFRGTSNPYLAMRHSIKPNGTYAHELPMAMQALYGPLMSNKMAMEHWVQEYRGNLGIALPDTLTTKVFLNDFDTYYAKLFDGIRQDSGNPKVIGNMVIDHYNKINVNPLDKILVFSDSLNVEKAIDLHEYFKGRIRTTFGIGTNLTNDVGWEPSNHVIKLISIDFGKGMKELIKLSDDPGKALGESQLVQDICRAVGASV